MAVKLCKECRFSYRPWFSSLECRHPEIGPMEGRKDYVDGHHKPAGWWICDVKRMGIHTDECGPQGIRWEKS